MLSGSPIARVPRSAEPSSVREGSRYIPGLLFLLPYGAGSFRVSCSAARALLMVGLPSGACLGSLTVIEAVGAEVDGEAIGALYCGGAGIGRRLARALSEAAQAG